MTVTDRDKIRSNLTSSLMVGETLFPKIGEIVEQADRIQTADEPTLADDERVVEEIESLCMKCHEQVRSLLGGLAFHSGSNQGVTRLMLDRKSVV